MNLKIRIKNCLPCSYFLFCFILTIFCQVQAVHDLRLTVSALCVAAWGWALSGLVEVDKMAYCVSAQVRK